LSPLPASSFDSASAIARLEKYFEVGTLEGLGSFSRVEAAAAGAVLAYVEKTQLGARPALQRPLRQSAGETLFIDAATARILSCCKPCRVVAREAFCVPSIAR
jgi:DNA mismatch repair protein MutS